MAIASFFTSAILIALLVLLRRTEIRRGNRFFSSFRAKLDKGAVALSVYFLRVLPKQVAKIFHYVIIHITDLFSSALLRVIQLTEGKLHRFVHAVRGKKQVQKSETKNDYFKDVQNHKREVSKTIEELGEKNH